LLCLKSEYFFGCGGGPREILIISIIQCEDHLVVQLFVILLKGIGGVVGGGG
jgi:hypothetical protein